MSILGLSILDALVLIVYIFGMLWIGKLLSKKVKNEDDFYLAGRKLGKAYQFFLNFGSMTDANGAASVSSIIFRQGVGGVWMAMQTLFMTPYYWFMNVWFRRTRLMTVADLFEDRFGGRFLSGLYAFFNVLFAVWFIGFGYLVSYRTIEAMMVKPEAAYSIHEKEIVDDFHEYSALKEKYQIVQFDQAQEQRYAQLKSLNDSGVLKSYISYVQPLPFYIVYGLIVGAYIVLGGFTAAVVTDAFQAILIIAFSLLLIPFGLSKLGGFSGLHEHVPEYMFKLTGSEAMSEFTWYSILAILFASWVQIHAVTGNMAVSGSAKDEMSARIGAVTGGFAKRIMIIAWSLCALIAVGLYKNQISNPDMAWGVLTKGLLPSGLIGFMLAGILAANMSTLDAQAINLSALFVKNIYQPIFKNHSQKHYVQVGRLTIAFLLISGIFVAMYVQGILSLLKVLLTMNVAFGASILLLFFWRRLTRTAVIVQVFVTTLIVVILPWFLPLLPSVANNPELTIFTNEKYISLEGQTANAENPIQMTARIEPAPVFFERLCHVDPADLNSPLVGKGRFNLEVYILGKMRMDVHSLTKAGLTASRFFFDGLFPFVLLFALSLITKKTDEQILNKFYVKMKTKVAATPEKDIEELEKSLKDPARYNHLKIFKNSNWEFCKWNKVDTMGFMACWVMVLLILGLFYYCLNIGR